MKAACEEALKYGDALIPIDKNPTLVTVILNPVANKRKAKKEYTKYCEPLLHLAGLQVDVVQTAWEGHAKEITESLKGTQAIIVAGGDGTLSESVTGLLRRTDNANQFPIGILPLGEKNTFGNILFPGGKTVDKVKQLIEASMAIIKGNTVWKDVVKIEPLTKDNETPGRPIYALSSIHWGAFRDTLAKKDKYWYFGPWREYATFIFNGYKSSLKWQCKGTIKYTPPCSGCQNCIEHRPEPRNWKWIFLTSNVKSHENNDVSKIENQLCGTTQELCFMTSKLLIKTPNVCKDQVEIPGLNIVLGQNKYTYAQFVKEGWKRLTGEIDSDNPIRARTVELIPEDISDGDIIEIDSEDYDVKPFRIELLHNFIKFFVTSSV
ncbi:Acylglycerol kinase, mitochondrial [Eumeta japonica]|uniref:Acylglycerol kinase, mitochondrial n=1 Tax=Eumeta variegata TaxID=151549 RepID=A0A4C1Z616_EUMVA|nr:Acylglycerol kinase, mitochondrial [Eumeta japonica]